MPKLTVRCQHHQRLTIESGLVGKGTARAEDAQGTPAQSHTLPSVLVYEDTASLFLPVAIRRNNRFGHNISNKQSRIDNEQNHEALKT